VFFFFNVFPYISIFSLTALVFIGLPLEFSKHYSIFETGAILSSFYLGTMTTPFLFYRVMIGYITTRISIIMNITAVSILFISLYINNGLYLSMISLFLLGVGKNVVLTYYDSKIVGNNYHLYRAVGSVAFVATALGIGLDYIDLNTIGIIITLVFFINYFSILYMKNEDGIIAERNFFSIKDIIKNKFFWLSIFFHRIGMGIFLSFAGIFLVYTLNYSELDFSYMWILAASLEGLVLFFYIQFLSPKDYILISISLTVVRFILIYLFPEYYIVLLFSQSLHIFSYAIYHVNILKIINQTFKERTPINIKTYHSISEGLSLFIGTIIGVYISDKEYFFLILSIFTIISLILFLISLNKENMSVNK